MTLLSRGLGLLSLDVITNSNVAFYFSGIKRKPLELYWNQTLCLLESIWLACTSGATVVWENKQEFMSCLSSETSVCPCQL